MLTGKRFRLQKETLALRVVDGKSKAIAIPVGGIVTIVSGPTAAGQMVVVVWESKTFEMFAVDVELRGTEITEPERPDQCASA